MKVKRLLIFIALMLSFSIAITDFMPNYARDTTGLIGTSISQKLAGSLIENDLAVTLDPDPTTMITSESACPGLQVTYYLMVTNASGDEETVTFSPSGNSWTTLIDPSSITLLDGEMEYIAVAVQIPWTTNPGDLDVVTITASGQTSGLSDSVTLTTITAIAQGWEDFENSPSDRGTRAPSVVYWDGKIYKIGGYGYVENVGGARPWVDIYDIETDTWIQGADMPQGRYWMDCEAIDATGADPKIYCAGGYRPSVGQSTLYIYDIASDSWSTGQNLPESRYNYASVTHDNLYYVLGGYTTAVTNTMLVYDPATDTWDETKPAMTDPRRYFSAGLIGGKIYAAGGYNTTGELSSLEIYDIAAGSWSAGVELPTTWLNAADGVIDDRFLIMVGGFEEGTAYASNRAMLYDSVHESWSLLPIFNHAIYGAEGAGDGDQFWVVSGRLSEDGFKNSTYITKLMDCEGGVCIPVANPEFTWDPVSPTVGTLVTFTATIGAGSPSITYSWDFGDGTPRYGENVDYTFLTEGTFTVTLTVSNCDGGSTAEVSHEVTVTGVCSPVTGPDFTWQPLSPTAGDAVDFTGSVTGGSLPINYTWDFGDGSTGNGTNPEHTFASAGTFTVTLTVTNCNCSATEQVSKDLTILQQDSSFTIYLPLIIH